MQTIRLGLIMASVFCLAGCGMKGALYLPAPTPAKPIAAPTPQPSTPVPTPPPAN